MRSKLLLIILVLAINMQGNASIVPYKLDSLIELHIPTIFNDSLGLQMFSPEPFSNWKDLEAFRRQVNSTGIKGDSILVEAYQTFLMEYELNINEIDFTRELLLQAERFSYSHDYLADTIIVYQVLGDMIFTQIANNLEALLEENGKYKRNTKIMYIINRLAENKYFIDIHPGNLHKFWKHFWNGNWTYLWHKATSSYWKESLLIVSVGLSLIIVIIIFWFNKRKSR